MIVVGNLDPGILLDNSFMVKSFVVVVGPCDYCGAGQIFSCKSSSSTSYNLALFVCVYLCVMAICEISIHVYYDVCPLYIP